jgi:hypothetical protein
MALQNVEPVPLVVRPEGQGVHAAEPPIEAAYLPTGQAVQAADPAVAAKVPGAHDTHEVASAAPLKVPGIQATAGPEELGQYCPAIAVQLPGGTLTVQAAAPMDAVVVPWAHGRQSVWPIDA